MPQTYDKEAIKALIQTLRQLFQMRPGLLVIIAGVVRNADTFQTFQDECGMFPYYHIPIHSKHGHTNFCSLLARSNFAVEEITFAAKPMREQKALFYAAAVPIRILSITSHG